MWLAACGRGLPSRDVGAADQSAPQAVGIVVWICGALSSLNGDGIWAETCPECHTGHLRCARRLFSAPEGRSLRLLAVTALGPAPRRQRLIRLTAHSLGSSKHMLADFDMRMGS